MNSHAFRSLRLQRILHALVLLALLLSPLHSMAAYSPPPAPSQPVEPGMAATGLYRTTITLRTPADWARLEKLGVAVLETTADGRRPTAETTADGYIELASSAHWWYDCPIRNRRRPTMTNAEWLQAFQRELERRFPDRSTARHYVSDLRIFLRAHAGPLSEVTAQDVSRFVDTQRAQGLSAATVKRRVAALKTFFDFLAEELGEPARVNPVSMRRHAGRQARRLPHDLSDAEVARFLAVVDSARDRAMIHLMLYAGLRVGEVSALRAVDIHVPEDPEAPIRLRVMGKGRKERVAYLCRPGYASLAAYLETQPLQDPEQPVFRNRHGQPITVSGIQARVRHYAYLSGVAVTCHRLRHTFGRWMAEGEMPVLTLARLLGHAHLQTTQRYIDGADPQVRRSYEAAMAHAQAAAAPPSPTLDLPPPVVMTGSPTVVREVPTTFEEEWMPDWPAWLREGCLDWVRHKWHDWKPSRRLPHARARLRSLRQFWQWQLARATFTGWEELTSDHIAAFVDAQLARGLKAKTVKGHLDTLYQVLRYLVAEGRLTEVPPRPKLKLPAPLPQHLSIEEVARLEAFVARWEQTAQGDDWLEIALYYLLSHVGLRLSEAVDLQVQDLDLMARRIRVREGKGRRDRVVPMTRQAAEGLRRYLETVPHAAEDLLLSCNGQPLSDHMAYRRIRRLGEAAGVSGVSPRRLRHTYATLLLNNGVSLPSLQKLMGHDSIKTTLIYARLADKTVERQYRTAMERVFTTDTNGT